MAALRLLTFACLGLAVGLFYAPTTTNGAALMDLVAAPDILHYSEATCRFEDSLVIITETMNQLTIRLADFSESVVTDGNRRRSSPTTPGISMHIDHVRKMLDSWRAKYRDTVKQLATNRTKGDDDQEEVTDDEEMTDDEQQESPILALERHRRNIKLAIEQMLADEATTSTRGPESTKSVIDIDQIDLADVDKIARKWHAQLQSCLAQYRALQQIISFEHFLKRTVDQLEANLEPADKDNQDLGSSVTPPKKCWLASLQASMCKVVRSVQEWAESWRDHLLLGLLLVGLVAIWAFCMTKLAKRTGLIVEDQPKQLSPPRKC